jgi:signal transduction histidine kinase
MFSNFPISFNDFLTLLPIFTLVTFLFYLSSKEVKKSLDESIQAQDLLTKDRDFLVKRLEESTRELQETRLKRLEDLEKAAEFGRLAQGLFHDLMTPFTSILLHTEKLKEIRGAHQSVEKTIEASHRMAAYIKDIRATLAQEESERLCSLPEELQSVLHMLAYAARNKNVEIVTQIEKCEWFGSQTKIRQLFSNLISNALDSFDVIKDDREKRIEIELYTKNGSIIFSVKDTGCGISDSNRTKIFEPFFTTKPSEQGTGIGLATVKTIVEKNLHGKITLESTEDEGSTFTIIFPECNRDPAASLPPR